MREKYESLSLATLKDFGKSQRIKRGFSIEKTGIDRENASRR